MSTRIVTPAGAAALPQPPDNLATPIMAEQGVEVEYYAPAGTDVQTPHDRDELYFIAKGTAVFTSGEDRMKVAVGDMIFVPAGDEHRFEEIAGGFATWVIFYGTVRRQGQA
jgi:mannose-6-phosphate isomerase-like protein (cupin superfamily)